MTVKRLCGMGGELLEVASPVMIIRKWIASVASLPRNDERGWGSSLRNSAEASIVAIYAKPSLREA